MERSALYRRALAPTVAAVGITGVLGSSIGIVVGVGGAIGFVVHWLVVAVCALLAALWVVRRQALGAGEAFWSSPTKRVAAALMPAFLSGGLVAILGLGQFFKVQTVLVLPGLWMLFYGCALHSAGFFTPRGLRLFGWIFLGMGAIWLCIYLNFNPWLPFGTPDPARNAHALMGAVFGLGHLAYAAYLHLTERKNAA
jgi:hypothetical protein